MKELLGLALLLPWAVAEPTPIIGRFFVAVLPKNSGFSSDVHPYLTMGNAGAEAARGLLFLPDGSEVPVTVPPGRTVQFNLPASLELADDADEEAKVEAKSFRLATDKPVSLLVSSEYSGDGSSLSYSALPVTQWGRRYLALTADTSPSPTDPNFHNQIHVVARETGAAVNITGLVELSLQLQPFEVATFASPADLTGMLVESSAPVGLVAGSRCAVVGASGCDAVAEMLPPVESLGRQFPLVSLAGDLGQDSYKALAAQDDTVLLLNGVAVASLAQRQFYSFTASSAVMNFVNATGPILLVQIGRHLQTKGYGDPLFIAAPPVRSFVSGPVLFRTPAQFPANNTPFVNFVSVIVERGSRDAVLFNGQPLSNVSRWFAIPTTDFVGLGIPIANGEHTVSATDPAVRYAVLCYGYSYFVGYGFAAGVAYEGLGGGPESCSAAAPAFGPNATLGDACGQNGLCLPTGSSVRCLCSPGYAGPFCLVDADSAAMSVSLDTVPLSAARCAVYATTAVGSTVPTSCPGSQACLPDDPDCLNPNSCPLPLGWCLPLAQVSGSTVPTSCPGSQACLPDDPDCLNPNSCPLPLGWCLPLAQVSGSTVPTSCPGSQACLPDDPDCLNPNSCPLPLGWCLPLAQVSGSTVPTSCPGSQACLPDDPDCLNPNSCPLPLGWCLPLAQVSGSTVPTSCPGSQACLPDDPDCLNPNSCPLPLGWCLPLAQVSGSTVPTSCPGSQACLPDDPDCLNPNSCPLPLGWCLPLAQVSGSTVPTSCPGSQACLPDDPDCLNPNSCPLPLGWCLPLAQVSGSTVPTSCPGSQACLPDDPDCLNPNSCPLPLGWCLPLAQVMAFINRLAPAGNTTSPSACSPCPAPAPPLACPAACPPPSVPRAKSLDPPAANASLRLPSAANATAGPWDLFFTSTRAPGRIAGWPPVIRATTRLPKIGPNLVPILQSRLVPPNYVEELRKGPPYRPVRKRPTSAAEKTDLAGQIG